MVSTQLNEIAEFLKTNPYNLSQPLQDGCLNSSVNEEEILNTIKDYFPIQLPRTREWWDFSFERKTIFFILLILKPPPQKPLTILIVN